MKHRKQMTAAAIATALAGSLALMGAAAAAPAAGEGKAVEKPAATAPGRAAEGEVFAVIGDVVLSAADFHNAFNSAARSKYYHSKPPEGELARFQREVGLQLVDRVLVVREARRRGLTADAKAVKEQLARYEARSRHAPNWERDRARYLASMTEQYTNQSLHEQMEKSVRNVPQATGAQARAYYDAHRDQFVEPEQVRLAVIVLKVDPSSPQKAWDAAGQEAARIHARLKAGGDFGELARMHSGDETAAKGGDMGYLHRGMLPEAVQKAVDSLPAGAISEPLKLLEGYTLLRVVDRRAARPRAFADVRERAAELWQREESAARWSAFVVGLRRSADVRINESLFLPLPPTEKARTS